MKTQDLHLYTMDAPGFAREILKFHADPVQLELLTTTPHRCILNCTRQWGKSTVTAIKALHTALFTNESLTIVLSPSERQSAEFIRKVAQFANKAGFKPRGDGQNSISLLFPNSSRIIGLPSNEHTIRGFSAPTLVLIDEASRVPDELYRTVRPMLAVSGGALWLISTPAGRRGFFYDTWRAPDTPYEKWTRISVPATSCPRIKPEFLETELKTHGERAFRQEYLCEFHDADDQLLSRDILERARSNDIQPFAVPPSRPVLTTPYHEQICVYPKAPPVEPALPDLVLDTKVFLGIDFGQANDYTTLAILEKTTVLTGAKNHWNYERAKEERFSIRHLERLPLGTPYPLVVARIGQIVRSAPRKPDMWLCADATGVGRPVIDMIRDQRLGCMLYAVTVTSGNTESSDSIYYNVPKSKLLNQLILQFESGTLKVSRHLDLAETLLEELAGLRVKVTSAGNDIYTTWRTNQHDDLLFAVALAHWLAQRCKW